MATNAIGLYRAMLRQAIKFGGYNFRYYAIRRVRDGFEANRSLADPSEIQDALSKGRETLAMLHRQSTISQMYTVPDLVVESSQNNN